MKFTPLTALSPLDGRYHDKVDSLRPYFSELGLIRYRVLIEIEWLKALSAEAGIAEIPPFSAATVKKLNDLAASFSEADAEQIKIIEKRTNHDVKAVEYWLREKLVAYPETAKSLEFIHFACTSEDINNLSHALMLMAARDELMLPALDVLINRLRKLALKLTGVTEALLQALGFNLLPVQDSHLCCGSAGTYSILQGPLSRRLLAEKVKHLEALRPALIATALLVR